LRGRPRKIADLLRGPRSAEAAELWLVIVDASASTRRNQGLAQAKGLLAQVFDIAYRQRARLALVTASGGQPRWHWQGLKASSATQIWLDGLGAGGGTPLAQAMQEAAGWLKRRQIAHPTEQQRLLLVTDGRLKEWPGLPRFVCPALLVDIESGPVRLGRAMQLARQLGAEYRHIELLSKRD